MNQGIWVWGGGIEKKNGLGHLQRCISAFRFERIWRNKSVAGFVFRAMRRSGALFLGYVGRRV